jgi:hypothetical protein
MIPPIKQLTVTSDGDTDDLTEHLLQVVQTDDTHIRNVTNLHNRSTLWDKYKYHPYLTDKDEVQKGQVTCLRSHSKH